jgi:3-keto-5-aminohexanoate cleavage enzyme
MTFADAGQALVSVGLNEDVTRAQHAHVPYGLDEVVDDAVRCSEAGASLIHFHARTDDGRQLKWDLEPTRAVLEGIAQCTDALAFPTTYSPPGADLTLPESAPHVWAAVDPAIGPAPQVMPFDLFRRGTMPMWNSRHDRLVAPGDFGDLGDADEAASWQPPAFLAELVKRRVLPAFICFEPGDVRWVMAVARTGLVPQPVLVQLHLFGHLLWGASPTAAAIDAALAEWDDEVDGELLFCVQMAPSLELHDALLDHCLQRGVGIRTGVGDNPQLLQGLTNQQVVQRMVQRVRAAGLAPVGNADLRRRFAPAVASVRHEEDLLA